MRFVFALFDFMRAHFICCIGEEGFLNEVSFFWRPMLARPVTNGNVFVFGMKDTAGIEFEQADGNLWPEFFHWTCLI